MIWNHKTDKQRVKKIQVFSLAANRKRNINAIKIFWKNKRVLWYYFKHSNKTYNNPFFLSGKRVSIPEHWKYLSDSFLMHKIQVECSNLIKQIFKSQNSIIKTSNSVLKSKNFLLQEHFFFSSLSSSRACTESRGGWGYNFVVIS